MVKMTDTNGELTTDDIKKFEEENNLKLTKKYKEFLLKWNGGYVEPHVFKISEQQGSSSMNVFNGIGDIDDSLSEYIDILDDRLPEGFIPIGDDSNGNQICLGIKEPHYDHIYFWDHEDEQDEPDMSNMYFLAHDIWEFLDSLYDDADTDN